MRDEATESPCPGYLVVEASGISAHCNVNGMFQLELDAERAAPGKYKTFHVYSPDGARVATVRKALEPGLVLPVDRVSVLFGRVVDASGRPVRAEAVVIRSPRGAHIASVDLDELDGSFRAPVAAKSIESAELVVQVELDGYTFSLPCPTRELLQPEGATLVLDLCDVRFRVRLSDGEPADKASLELIVRRANQAPQRIVCTRPEADAFSGAFPLDAEGVVDVTLERALTSVTVEVGLHGYAPWTETLPGPPCGTIWDVSLLKLEPEDVISGRVVTADGAPIAGVEIRCGPPMEDSELYARVLRPAMSWTGEDGTFSVPYARGRPAVLGARLEPNREIPPRPVHGGDRDIELRFDPVQRVTLDLIGPSGGAVRSSGPEAIYLLFLGDGDTRSEFGALDSMVLEDVPVGRHRACVVVGEPVLFGAVDVDVRAGSDVRLDVVLRSAFTTTGRVVDAAGTPLVGARIRLVDPPWPHGDSRQYFSTRSRSGGWFEVFLADRPRAELELSYEGREPVRVLVDADTPETWTLP